MDGPANQDSIREIGATSGEPLPGVCPNCGYKKSSTIGNTDRKAVFRTTSLPANPTQGQGHFAKGLGQIRHMRDTGHINPVYEESPVRTRSDLSTIIALIKVRIALMNTGRASHRRICLNRNI